MILKTLVTTAYLLTFFFSEMGYTKETFCNPKNVFSGRFFGLAKKIALFNQQEKNYQRYHQKKSDLYGSYFYQLKKICHQHSHLISEAKRRSLSYPQITQSEFLNIHSKKMMSILEKHIEKTKSHHQAISSVVNELKNIGYPHQPDDTDEDIYKDFSKTIEHQIMEEIRQGQIQSLERILFGQFDQLYELNNINKHVKKIKEKLDRPIFSSGVEYENFIKKYNLHQMATPTKKSGKTFDQYSKTLQQDFLSIAEKNLKKSMYVYIDYVKKIKNPKEKLKHLEETTDETIENPQTEIKRLLYKSKLANEDEKLYFLQLNFNSRPITSYEGLKYFPASYSYLKLNCPHLFQAIQLKLEIIIKAIQAMPHFSTITAKIKTMPYSFIYQQAITAAKIEKFEKERSAFYRKHHILY